MKQKLEKELWAEQIITKSDNLYYLTFLQRNLHLFEIPDGRKKRIEKKITYKINKMKQKIPDYEI